MKEGEMEINLEFGRYKIDDLAIRLFYAIGNAKFPGL
jgi:hypothetical protein